MDIISSPPLSIILNSGWALTSSRITRIIQARTLDDASHMGLIDRLYDRFFRKGGKRAAITRLYRQLSQPAPESRTILRRRRWLPVLCSCAPMPTASTARFFSYRYAMIRWSRRPGPI